MPVGSAIQLLPNDSYVVHATADISNTNPSPAFVVCNISPSGPGIFSGSQLSQVMVPAGSFASPSDVTASIGMTVSQGAVPGSVQLFCQDFSGSSASVRTGELDAIQVGSVTNI